MDLPAAGAIGPVTAQMGYRFLDRVVALGNIASDRVFGHPMEWSPDCGYRPLGYFAGSRIVALHLDRRDERTIKSGQFGSFVPRHPPGR
jgi:hypothetical protein